jgi:hypothetical protein
MSVEGEGARIKTGERGRRQKKCGRGGRRREGIKKGEKCVD